MLSYSPSLLFPFIAFINIYDIYYLHTSTTRVEVWEILAVITPFMLPLCYTLFTYLVCLSFLYVITLLNTGCLFLCVGTTFGSTGSLGTIVTNIIMSSARQAISSKEFERSQHPASNYAQNFLHAQLNGSTNAIFN